MTTTKNKGWKKEFRKRFGYDNLVGAERERFEHQEEFMRLATEMKKWFEERDLKLGYTDTYYGNLALLIQEEINKAIADFKSNLLARLEGK